MRRAHLVPFAFVLASARFTAAAPVPTLEHTGCTTAANCAYFLEPSFGVRSGGKPLSIAELTQTMRPSDLQVSPEGKRVAFTLTQRSLAEFIGVTQPTILALERHGRGRLEILDRVLGRLGAGAYLIASGEKKAFFTHAGNASTHHGWETPTAILETLYAVFGKFDLDPCSPRRTRPPVRAKVHYTAEDDGLSLPWHGVVFVNPPYGRELPRWVAKARSEVERKSAKVVVALIPARTDTHYWHDHIAGKADVYFLRGRLRFGADGQSQSAPFPSAIAIWGANPVMVEKLDAAFPDAWKTGTASRLQGQDPLSQ